MRGPEFPRANLRVGEDGRVVAYLGDDEKFEYLYKFVSDGRMKAGGSRHARRPNMSLLDSGTLYAARFTGNSAGEIDGSRRPEVAVSLVCLLCGVRRAKPSRRC